MDTDRKIELETVSLENLGGGTLGELFALKLTEVLENIWDPNTDPGAARKITLEVTFKPDEDRDSAGVSLKAKASLAPHRGSGTVIYMGRQGGTVKAVERNPKQLQMDLDEENRPAEFPAAGE